MPELSDYYFLPRQINISQTAKDEGMVNVRFCVGRRWIYFELKHSERLVMLMVENCNA